MSRRGFTMLEMTLAVAILSAFIAVYVAWSTAALRITKSLDESGGEILADRALEWIVRDYRDQVPRSAFEFDEEQEREEAGDQAGEDVAVNPEESQDAAADPSDAGRQPPGEGGSTGARRLAVTQFGAQSYGLDTDRVEVITPHWAPGEEPGFYVVSYYLRDGSLWRQARHIEGGGARSVIVTGNSSRSGDELEVLRNVLRFEILPAKENNPRAGAIITLEMELENEKVVTRQRIVDTRRRQR
jgi:prepilin-type N-terminal cleavage/methylation domain-containing protein